MTCIILVLKGGGENSECANSRKVWKEWRIWIEVRSECKFMVERYSFRNPCHRKRREVIGGYEEKATNSCRRNRPHLGEKMKSRGYSASGGIPCG